MHINNFMLCLTPVTCSRLVDCFPYCHPCTEKKNQMVPTTNSVMSLMNADIHTLPWEVVTGRWTPSGNEVQPLVNRGYTCSFLAAVLRSVRKATLERVLIPGYHALLVWFRTLEFNNGTRLTGKTWYPLHGNIFRGQRNLSLKIKLGG